MSIMSNISTAFFSDWNTFATPRRLYLRQSRVSEREERAGLSPQPIDLCFWFILAIPTSVGFARQAGVRVSHLEVGTHDYGYRGES